MLQKLFFWFGLSVFAIGQFFVLEVLEFNLLAGGQVTAYILVVMGLGLIAASNVLKQKN